MLPPGSSRHGEDTRTDKRVTVEQEGLDLMLQLRDPLAQLGIFGFEFRYPEVTRVVHDRIACQ